MTSSGIWIPRSETFLYSVASPILTVPRIVKSSLKASWIALDPSGSACQAYEENIFEKLAGDVIFYRQDYVNFVNKLLKLKNR